MSARVFTLRAIALLAGFFTGTVMAQFDGGNPLAGPGRLKDFQAMQFVEALQGCGVEAAANASGLILQRFCAATLY